MTDTPMPVHTTEAALTLYPYQKRWLADDSRFKVGMFARQTGKTFTTTLEIVLDCLDAEAEGKRARWVILSRGERQAKEAMNEGVKRHLQAAGIACEVLTVPFDATVNALEVVFPNGSKITALPANPDTARGFSANVFLDEFAFHQDSRAIWKALFPVISAGWKLRVVSTPNGKGNKFYELMTDLANTEWSRHVVDIYQAVADGLPREIDELKAGLNDPDAWAQEFELQWLDEASAWLSHDLIHGAEHPQAGLPEHYSGGVCFVGVDIAVRNDLFVVWVLEQVGDVLWTRELIVRRRISFAEQADLLADVFARYRVIRCCIDQTGLGEKPVEDAKTAHGESRVEGVLFTAANKLALATVGKEAFEDQKIRIPIDQDLRTDLHKLQKVTSPTGAPRFVAEADANGHADRTWAAFLALNAAQQDVGSPRVSSRACKRVSRLTRGYW
ncbi:terminase large subunit domain-containing protein [Stenoxybacter acetivorans]|uniref:terminase large subunit domain-containing protein n=1 Tax=Stenoxybacter acetivorans TaxID=422441 RepID=UPI000A771AFA|nr:terminase family protein [Stenoxybacter acetivorans]